MSNADLNNLVHYGIPGMKWGVRKQRDRVESFKKKSHVSDSKEDRARKQEKRARNTRIGKSVAIGILGGNIGAVAAFKVTGNLGLAKGAAIGAAVISGRKYYQSITNGPRKKNR